MEHTLEENVLTHFGGYEKNSLIHTLNDDQELDADFPMFKHSHYYTRIHSLIIIIYRMTVFLFYHLIFKAFMLSLIKWYCFYKL